jgi:hypothetical protein
MNPTSNKGGGFHAKAARARVPPLLFLAELIKNALPNNLTKPSVRLSVKKLRNESSSWLAIVSENLYQRLFLFSALP